MITGPFGIIFILVLIVGNGFLAMAEISIVSARKARLQSRAEAGSRRYQAALDLANSPGNFLSTVQIGITLVGILAGAAGEAALAGQIEGWLLAQGLSRGMRLRVTEKTSRRICIEVDGHEHILAPVVAANLSIEQLPKPTVPDLASRRLSDLTLGEEATVLGILPGCRGAQRR